MSSLGDLSAVESMVANSFGAALIGAVVAAMLYGLTTLQTYFYFMNYPGDKIQLKILVWALWLIDSLHTALGMSPSTSHLTKSFDSLAVTYCVYFYLVMNFMNPSGLANINWAFNVINLPSLEYAILTNFPNR
ncbi:hypothetical protein GYMLUDRAFT_243864 [Collybiopsis luxurians FD-317 M1]|uniref:Uncharacterized protein n=1 Tax=Collybiopsis luxurians FD-317 M1 TaxID=944289 RepID=A0A0D0CY15_9AGAR|nr:hypothetical protein GYMLUDRAFT_243864 [Collybiopsis luxurians FD-317 M1]